MDIWKTVIIDNAAWNYEVSQQGGYLRQKNTQKIRKLIYKNNGYVAATLFNNNKRKYCYIHRLIASAFIVNDDPEHKTQVDHIDHKRDNNDVSNLRWVTPPQNSASARQKPGRKSTKKIILRYDLDNNPDSVVEYESAEAACTAFGSRIFDCLAGRIEDVYGYYWCYKLPQLHRVPQSELDMNLFIQIQNHPNYILSKEGRVYNPSRESFLIGGLSHGYPTVILDHIHYYIHRLVAIHFNTGTPSQTVNHEDGNKTNNHVDNLTHMTYSENTHHVYRIGLRTLKKVLQFDLNKKFIAEYDCATRVTERYGIDKSHIGKACADPEFEATASGFKWRHKTPEICEEYNLDYTKTNYTDNPDRAKKLYVSNPVLKIDTAGKIVNEYASASIAAKAHNMKNENRIRDSCKDPDFKMMAGGFRWRFKNKYVYE